MSHKEHRRRSFIPGSDNEVSKEIDVSDNPFKNESEINHMEVVDEEENFKKQVKSKFRQYMSGLKELKNGMEDKEKQLFTNHDGGDHLEYLSQEYQMFLENLNISFKRHKQTTELIEKQKNMVKAIESFVKDLNLKKKLLQDLKENKSSEISLNGAENVLPIFLKKVVD